MAIYLSFNKNTNIYSAVWYLHASAAGWNPALSKNTGRASGRASVTARDHPVPKPRCHTQCSPPWRSHGVVCALLSIPGLFMLVINATEKDILEPGKHPGVFVSPSLCLYSVWKSLMECVGQRALLIPGKQQHMGSICITSDRNLTAAFKSYTKVLPPSYKYLKSGK